MSEETCKATTASGEPCQNEAGADGYCWLHSPADDEDDDDSPEDEAAAAAEELAGAADDDDGEAHERGAGEVTTPGERFPTVRVRAPNGGHIAGYSFARNEIKEVPATASVKNALRHGKLQNVA